MKIYYVIWWSFCPPFLFIVITWNKSESLFTAAYYKILNSIAEVSRTETSQRLLRNGVNFNSIPSQIEINLMSYHKMIVDVLIFIRKTFVLNF